MESSDVKSLFTNVPIGHALEVINKRLVEDETLNDTNTGPSHFAPENLSGNNLLYIPQPIL